MTTTFSNVVRGVAYCLVDGCDTPSKERGWCPSHYMKWWRYGDPLAGGPPSDEDFFWAKVNKTNDCWLWTGSINDAGYGVFRRGRGGRAQRAHRFSYALLVESVPASTQLDHRHTCPKNCVNPEHLRPVTPKQNMENRAGAQRNSKSGVRGVTWDKGHQRWSAQVGHKGRKVHVGYFATVEDATSAVVAKRLEIFTHNDADRGEAK